MTDTTETNLYDGVSNEAMADTLDRLAHSPRSLSVEARTQLLEAAARRIGNDSAVTVELDDGYTFVQGAPLGSLYADDSAEPLLEDVTLSTARHVAAVVQKLRNP